MKYIEEFSIAFSFSCNIFFNQLRFTFSLDGADRYVDRDLGLFTPGSFTPGKFTPGFFTTGKFTPGFFTPKIIHPADYSPLGLFTPRIIHP